MNAYEKDFGYSQAVLIDKTLYVSGTVAADADGRLVAPNDMAGQMRAAYTNHTSVRSRRMASISSGRQGDDLYDRHGRLLKAADLRFEFYDKERLPAISWVQVQRLLDPGFLVEIEVVAELP